MGKKRIKGIQPFLFNRVLNEVSRIKFELRSGGGDQAQAALDVLQLDPLKKVSNLGRRRPQKQLHFWIVEWKERWKFKLNEF